MAVAKSIANPITDQLTLKTPHLTIDMPGQKDAGGSAQSGGAAASAATTVSAESIQGLEALAVNMGVSTSRVEEAVQAAIGLKRAYQLTDARQALLSPRTWG